MAVNTADVATALKQLDSARNNLAALKEQRAKINLKVGHQEQVSVSVGGVRIELTTRDQAYNSVLIRGREMIALGVAKALNEVIREAEGKVRAIERTLQRLIEQ